MVMVFDSLESANTSLYRADDLIVEENENVIKALKRLPPKEAYDRVYRLRRAFQCSTAHQLLPKAEWTKPEEVSRNILSQGEPYDIFEASMLTIGWNRTSRIYSH